MKTICSGWENLKVSMWRTVRRKQIGTESRPAANGRRKRRMSMMRYMSPLRPAASHIHTCTSYSVHLVLLNQLRGIYKVLAIKEDDDGCNPAGGPPEHHVRQRLSPGVAWGGDSQQSGHATISSARTSLILPCPLWLGNGNYLHLIHLFSNGNFMGLLVNCGDNFIII